MSSVAGWAPKVSEVESDLRVPFNGGDITLHKSRSGEWNRTVKGKSLLMQIPEGRLFHAKEDRTAWVITELGLIYRIDLLRLEF